MSLSSDLFTAILSMDAYNREYNAGINITGSRIGTAKIVERENVGIDEADYQEWQNAGFYAVGYTWNDTTVISYRGTDSPSVFSWSAIRS